MSKTHRSTTRDEECTVNHAVNRGVGEVGNHMVAVREGRGGRVRSGPGRSGARILLATGVTAAIAATLLTSACGGGSKPAAAGAGARSSAPAPGPAVAGTALTTDQLKSALLGATDVAGYTSDASGDSDTLTTDQTKVSVGGPACQKFMDASDALVSAYGTSAQVDRQFTDAAGIVLHVTLTSYPSAAKAQAELDDLDAGVAGCKSAATASATAGSTDGATTLSLAAGPSVGAVAGSDGVVAYTVKAKQNGFDIMLVVETVRVGTAVVSVGLGGEGDVSQQQKQLEAVTAQEVAKVRSVQGKA